MLKAHLGHITLFAQDTVQLATFYQELFGMEVVGGAADKSSIFIGRHDEEENHQLAFIHNRKAAHIGLRVNTPGELLAYYQEMKVRKIETTAIYNHGLTLAFYIPDPEGNLIEIYWPTGREDYRPPYFGTLDLEGQTEESLRELVAKMPPQDVRFV